MTNTRNSCCVALIAASAFAQEVTFTRITTQFNNPIGIDYHAPTNTLIMSVNYSGGQPNNLERILPDGSHVPFSSLAGLTDELKIATVKVALGGFTIGDVFCGNGLGGQIVRVTANGAQVQNPWASLPGGLGLMRGGLFHDSTGVFGGDLIAVTTAGEVWRVNASGSGVLLASVGTHLEGTIVVPNDPGRYGPLAGRILAGAENQGLLYAIDSTGAVQTHAVGVNIEDIDLIPDGESLFGVNFGTGFLLGAPASTFAGMAGDILLTQEFFGGNAGIFRLHWDGTQLLTTPFQVGIGSAPVGQWEHVTFAPVGVVPFPTCEVMPLPPFSIAAGSPLAFQVVGADPDPLDIVTLTAADVPPAANVTPPLPAAGNPVTIQFAWTPELADVGTRTIVFTATDLGGLQTVCNVVVTITCASAAWDNYGVGWPGSGGRTPALTLSALPILGTTPDLQVENVRGSQTFGCLFLGPGPENLPTAYGGTILVQPGIEFPIPIGPVRQALPVAIPTAAALCGVQAWLQVVEFDEGASHLVAFTPGLHLVLGL